MTYTVPFDSLLTNEFWNAVFGGKGTPSRPTRGSSSDRAVFARAWHRQRPEPVQHLLRRRRHARPAAQRARVHRDRLVRAKSPAVTVKLPSESIAKL